MSDLIVFLDSAAAVIDYLNDLLSVEAHSKVPTDRADNAPSFVVVSRTGGPRRNIVTDQPQLTVEAWGADKGEAHDLLQEARGHINALPGQTVNDITFKRVEELGGPADIPDPASGQPRYTMSFSIAARSNPTGS